MRTRSLTIGSAVHHCCGWLSDGHHLGGPCLLLLVPGVALYLREGEPPGGVGAQQPPQEGEDPRVELGPGGQTEAGGVLPQPLLELCVGGGRLVPRELWKK